jgi:hypothetical protein
MSNPGGKGSSPRPLSVSQQQYAQRWDAIFGKDNPFIVISKLQKFEFSNVSNTESWNASDMLKNDAVFDMSEKRAEESTEIMQDSPEIRRVFEGDDNE